MWKSRSLLCGSLIFKVPGGQCGRLVGVFLRGVFQEASGGIFFEALYNWGDPLEVVVSFGGPNER